MSTLIWKTKFLISHRKNGIVIIPIQIYLYLRKVFFGSNEEVQIEFKTPSDTFRSFPDITLTETSAYAIQSTIQADAILSLDSDEFTVGSKVNNNGQEYNYRVLG